MKNKINAIQFHPLKEEDMFRLLSEISSVCAATAWVYSTNSAEFLPGANTAMKEKVKAVLPDKLNNAIKGIGALGMTGIPVDAYDKFVTLSRSSKEQVLFSDHVDDLESPRLWEMFDKYHDENEELLRLYERFYRLINIGIPDYILYRETGITGLHMPDELIS